MTSIYDEQHEVYEDAKWKLGNSTRTMTGKKRVLAAARRTKKNVETIIAVMEEELMVRRNIPYNELHRMKTLRQGQYMDLKFDNGRYKVWLSRLTKADGVDMQHEVLVEKKGSKCEWRFLKRYDAR